MAGTWDSDETLFAESPSASEWYNYPSCKVDGAGNRIELIWTHYTLGGKYVLYDYLAVGKVDTYASDYSTFKDNFPIGETVYAKATGLITGNQYDFKYYSNWGGTPVFEYNHTNVGETPSGEWRSSYTLQENDPSGTWGVRVFDAGTSTLRCNCSFTVPALTDKTAFTDGGSVPIGTGETTLATLSTLFSAGNNFVIAIVQLSSSASTSIAAGNLRLTRGGTTLRSNQYIMPISSSDPHQQKWFALMALDSSAPANPTYDVRATAAATGISGEAKILAISGLTGASVQGTSTLIDGPWPAKTTLATLSTSLPAGDNVVLAIVESINDVDNSARRDIRECRLNRQSGSTLAEAQYYMFHDQMANVGRWHVHLIPYLDVGAPANPTYNVTCEASLANVIHGRATIVAFSKGSLSAAYSDGVNANIGTSETVINKLNTNFGAGSEVAVIASEQFWSAESSNYNYINADLNKLQQNNASTGQATNQYTLRYPLYGAADNGKGFGLLNRFTNTPLSPQYEVKATKSSTYSVNVEAKILALACGSYVDTYDSDYSTLKDTFDRSVPETVYAKATGLSIQAGWLSGWDKRVKLTIDNTDIDSDLSDFPVLVHLSTSSGRGPDDVSFVFDELQSDANRKKIAVTKDDGTAECYVEIEDWDDASEEAWLWVKVSGTDSVSSSTDTDLYLYYDADHADNTAYVGDSGSRTEVWDSNFVGVWHLNETPNDDVAGHLDSTSNNNDGTPQNFQDEGGGTTDATGKIGGADYFAGDNDEVLLPNEIIGGSTAWTLTAWIQTTSTDKQTIYGEGYDGDHYLYIDKDATTPYVEFYLENDPYYPIFKGDINVVGTQFHHITIVQRSQTNRELFVDGVPDQFNDTNSGTPTHDMASIGLLRNRDWTADPFNGTIDEVRISNTNRSTAWIKASYESERDDLIDFAGEEPGPRYDFRYYSDWTGTPTEQGSQLNVAESPSGEWRSLYDLQGTDPTGTWGVRVFDAGTSTERCSCSFTVQSAVPEFPYGAIAVVVTCFAIYLTERKTVGSRWKGSRDSGRENPGFD